MGEYCASFASIWVKATRIYDSAEEEGGTEPLPLFPPRAAFSHL